MQNSLGVASGFESALPQNRSQIGVVVDLTVGDQNVIGTEDRLRPVRRPDDRESAMGHHRRDVRRPVDARLVGAAVADLLDHPPRERFVIDLPEAGESTHGVVLLGRRSGAAARQEYRATRPRTDESISLGAVKFVRSEGPLASWGDMRGFRSLRPRPVCERDCGSVRLMTIPDPWRGRSK